MKIIIKLFICLSLIYTPFFAFAGAAEKWEYDVIPDQNQKLKVSGHKVDQFGDAVNDNNYTTTIDPKTTSNRQKMGTVGMSRLLKVTGWGTLGYEALKALLEAVDWVIDPEAQSIWRNKKPTDSVNCSYTYNEGGKTYFYKFKGATDLFLCPLEAAKSIVEAETVNNQYAVKNSAKFERWILFNVDLQFKFEYSYKFKPEIQNGKTVYFETSLAVVKTKIEAPTPDKEYLSPEQLADYANHTHPDYSNPELAPKLEPKYKPSIQTDLWKPSNKFEEENSPTVQEVQRQLEQANPTSKDKDIEQKTDEEGNPTGSFSLPEFCSWATPVCDFFKWSKQNDELPDNESPDIVEHVTPDLEEDAITWGAACPADVSIPISMQGVSSTLVFSWSPWCQLLSIIKPAIIASAYIGAAFIVLGLRT